jgi:pYEATS domain-containing protein involved in immunity
MMDKLPTNINLTPHLVKNPLALIAFAVGAIVVLAIATIWIPLWFALSLIAVVIVVVGIPVAFLLKNPERYTTMTKEFEDFESEATQHEPPEKEPSSDLDALRDAEYKQNRGLFLTHSWRPSEKRGQVADVIIRLAEHLDISMRSPVLKGGKVESVRYELGRKFFEEPVLKRNYRDDFALEVSAYRPMLCVAEVRFNDSHPPIRLSRYIDFPTGTSED